MIQEKRPPAFLSGGGEMGELTRLKDWSKTSLGDPETWPQSLKTILGLLLNSKFPMFLWWGPDLICFYNDAYRPSLGENGKHPTILGMKGETAWTEAWGIIKPLVDQVLTTGEATWFEDQLVPIFRNGQVEDVYWTFSYSPVNDDSGKRAGVFVTCTETTGKVYAYNELEESNKRFVNNIMQAPVAMCIFRGKDHVVEIANDKMLELWGTKAEAVLNKSIFEGLPEARGQGLEALVDHVYNTGERFTANERPVDLPRNGKIETTYINFTYQALKEPDGKISGIIATAIEVTEQVIARQKIEASEQDLRSMVLQSPIGICILDASTLVSEIVNDSFIEVAGKPYEAIAGKYYWDTFAEAKPYYEAALNDVVKKGVPFYANEVELMLIRHGKEEIIYVTFVYAPLKNKEGEVKKVAIWVLENTQQVVARKKISEAEEKTRLAIKSADLGVYEIVYATNEMHTDERFKEIWGIANTNDWKQFIEIIHPDDREMRRIAHEESLKTGQIEYQPRIILKDGSIQWVKINGTVIYDDKKNPVKLIGIIQDITTIVSARQKVEEAEQRLRLATEAAGIATFDVDVKSGKVIYSDSLADIFGFNRNKEQHQNDLRSIIHQEDRDNVIKAFDVALNTGTLFYEARVVKPDNKTGWVRTEGKTYYDKENKPFKIVGTIRDITEEKKHQKVLLESETKFRLLADSMPQQVWTSDPEGNLNYFSKAVFNYAGFTQADIDKYGWIMIVHPDDREANIREWTESITTGKDFIFEHRFRRHDGEYRWQLSRAIPQRDSSGKIRMWVGTSTDIHDQKYVEEQLDQLVKDRTKQLQRSNEDLQQFAHVASHDLKEPLRKIKIYTNRLQDESSGVLSEKSKGFLHHITSATSRMQMMIDGVLSFSSIDSTQQPICKVNLNEIIKNVKSDLEILITQKEASIICENLPEIEGAEVLMYQLFYNLINNAIKFSKQNIAPVIKITTIPGKENEKDFLKIKVEDNGIGFEQKYAEKIFTTFGRLNSKDEYEGTGLGLSLCKKIVERHKGIIEAIGIENKSATFIITLPLKQEGNKL